MELRCSDGKYLPHAATTICSFLEHNFGSRVHLFHSADVDYARLTLLRSFVTKYDSQICFYEMTDRLFHEFRIDYYNASYANYYRLLAPLVLPSNINKILYLDTDIVVRRSLRDLWDTGLANYALAAVEDAKWDATKGFSDLFSVELTPGTKYFNSGVLLINLEYWRLHGVMERVIAFLKNPPKQLKYWDQDALNAVLTREWTSLPSVWNAQHQQVPGVSPVVDAAIVHYCGDVKPWYWSWSEVKHPYKYEYHRYRSKTPWRRYRLRELRPGWSWLWRVYRLLWRIGKRLLPVKVRKGLRRRISSAWAPSQD
jgi:lipopolysaccharide biosynthesis glycosyltransferase